ncbi:unnamed protein product [Rotaria sp. Silwood2]|nr:unnamed protein product [Rotaria sp. Silwood2]CAF2832736.1 unnamed protein product [Rotaria sp. Silwood2]CAF4359358.1 unnamed protein product [Rotaria sp. Silwood2]CAF4427238.1 unnamed protein product [Rotaria sp. Silwood2]
MYSFNIKQESDLFERIFCTNGREFTTHVLDNHSREFIRVHRKFQRCSVRGTSAGCMQEAFLECPSGQIIGTVQQEYQNDCIDNRSSIINLGLI